MTLTTINLQDIAALSSAEILEMIDKLNYKDYAIRKDSSTEAGGCLYHRMLFNHQMYVFLEHSFAVTAQVRSPTVLMMTNLNYAVVG